MPVEKIVKIYKFEELSDTAKERARAWYKECAAQDEFWDATYEDASTIADLMGIDLATRQTGTRRDKTPIYEVDIQFSGFWSQGDGASFTGTFAYKADALEKVKAHAPEDATLHAIVERLQAAHAKADFRASGSITRDRWGHYVHSNLMDVAELTDEEDPDREYPDELRKEFRDAFRAFADWIYSQLEKEDEYRNSDECVDDNIEANDYTFTEDGRREDA